MLIKTRFRGRDAGFLIHLEHQAQADPDLGRRMLEYFLVFIRDFALTLAQLRLARADKDTVAGFFFAYERLNAAEGLQLAREISKVESSEMREQIMHLTNPWIEAGKQQGLEQGLVKGRQQGEAELVLRQLTRQFGVPAASQAKAIRKLPLAKLEALGEALLEFTSR